MKGNQTMGKLADDAANMEYTGERMIPEVSEDTTFWEHTYRYNFASNFVRDKVALDIACGEGYGTASLVKAGARSVIGMDVSAEACHHAKVKYNVDARVGDAENIPLKDGAVDLVVSFETVEHVATPKKFISECKRVLRPGGTLIMSTPNRDAYSSAGVNPFHCSEMTGDEFVNLLSKEFKGIKMYAQNVIDPGLSWRYPLLHSKSRFMQLRGGYRTHNLIYSMTCQHLEEQQRLIWRSSPVEAVRRKISPLEALVNPYIVRPFYKGDERKMEYFIAVAHC